MLKLVIFSFLKCLLLKSVLHSCQSFDMSLPGDFLFIEIKYSKGFILGDCALAGTDVHEPGVSHKLLLLF